MSNKQLAAYEAKRDIGAELLQAAREIRGGKAARIHHVQPDGRIITVLNRRLKLCGPKQEQRAKTL